ncbi:MAG TPA: HD domain-containing protein [Longimicrobiaceae bacterium]|nr:HD domain-containing protein [Longimicrobiaceae bacterium]
MDSTADRDPFAGDDALSRRLRFALEAGRLTGVERRTRVLGGARQENSAEHSWHIALLAVVLADAAPPGADLARVTRMLLAHDLVEVHAGDTFCYDASANQGREDREQDAAARIFGLLPDAQAAELRALWDEFEAGETADARFAVALDRFQPLLLNYSNAGGSWLEHGVTRAQVMRRMGPIREGAPALWPVVLDVVERACAAGWIRPDPPAGG